VQEYVGANHEFAGVHGGRHFVNLYFEARLLEPLESRALQPDPGQVGLEWLEVGKLASYPFFPRALARALAAQGGTPGPVYLGDSV
jgi:hypothetical protein